MLFDKISVYTENILLITARTTNISFFLPGRKKKKTIREKVNNTASPKGR